MSAKMNKLLPCPFCGGEGVMDKRPRSQYGKVKYAYFIRCESCWAQGSSPKSEAGAVEVWNMRTARKVKETGRCRQRTTLRM